MSKATSPVDSSTCSRTLDDVNRLVEVLEDPVEERERALDVELNSEEAADREEQASLQRRERDDRPDRDRGRAARDRPAREQVDERRHHRERRLDRGHHPAAGHAAAHLEVGEPLRLASRTARARSPERPIVLPSRIPETDSDSWTIEETSASEICRSAVTFFRWSPTRLVSQTKSGSSARANAARRQSSSTIAMIVAITVVTFPSTDVAVVRDDVLDPADVVRDAALHLARPRPGEEGQRQALEMAVDGCAEVVHHRLADEVREQRLPDPEHARDDRDRDHPCDERGQQPELHGRLVGLRVDLDRGVEHRAEQERRDDAEGGRHDDAARRRARAGGGRAGTA